MSEAAVDGRRVRSDRSRAAVAEALLALYQEGNVQPGAADIAARAGVSERSVFRHFEDLESLARVTIERELERVGGRFGALEATGSRAERTASFVDHRTRLFQAVAPVARAATLLAHRSPTVAAGMQYRRAALRAQIATHFAPELARRTGRDREDLLDALDMACSFEAIDLLATTGRFTPARARRLLTRTINALLAHNAKTSR